MKQYAAAFVVVLISIVLVEADWHTVGFKDCGSEKGNVTQVQVNTTVDEGTVVLKKGTSVELRVSFTSNEDTGTLTSSVHGILGGIPIHFPLPNPNVCQDCNVTCPVKSGESYVYTPNIDVKTEYPSVRLVVKWEVKDNNNADVFCFDVPAEITD
ncbi:NPC intracellular cholesterol transporter 2-like [Babylonia areolata]|uniref:NPC intracellular cholesterol transporter 2-like n=1 Tax=Babylonia areolata TaxID=304850 RepID=UPI003FD26EA5